MNIFKRIKEFISPSEYYSAENITFENPSLEFYQIDEETILNITKYSKENISEAPKIEAKNLKARQATEFKNINDLVIYMVKAIELDYKEMVQEKWKFEYFMNNYFLDDNTTCIYSKFTSSETEIGNMICPLISIRKFDEKYYCWTHIDS
jgi:hypothetical protein